VHVYDHGYPLGTPADFQAPHATAEDYRRVQRLAGLSRVVVVMQPYGLRFRQKPCKLAALAHDGGPGERGFAVMKRHSRPHGAGDKMSCRRHPRALRIHDGAWRT